jgi:trimethylamine---corrinoid protein Co-methyltransferase
VDSLAQAAPGPAIRRNTRQTRGTVARRSAVDVFPNAIVRLFNKSLGPGAASMRPQLRVVPDHLINPILDEAMKILAEIGIEVRGARLRQRLLDHGLKLARTVDDAERVLFPPEVIARAIETTPKRFPLYDRDGAPYTELGGNKVHFVPGSSGLQVLDHRTGETRLSGTRDFIEYIRVADGLKNLGYLATAFSTNDIEPMISDAWRLYLVLTNSVKPVV